MENKHLSSVKIENYKRFNSLEINNLGQFNLVVGDNNTGKTCLLEALCLCDPDMDAADMAANLYYFLTTSSSIDEYLSFPKDSHRIHELLREGWDTFTCRHYNPSMNASKYSYFTLKVNLKNTNLLNIILRPFNYPGSIELLKNANEIKKIDPSFLYNLLLLKKRIVFKDQAPEEGNYVSLPIDNKTPIYAGYCDVESTFSPFHMRGKNIFYEEIEKNKQSLKKFISDLSIFIPEIEDIRSIQNKINIFEKKYDTPLPIGSYGSGAIKLFNILFDFALTNEGEIFMIDEVDAGIHYRRFKEFWRGLLRLAIKKNVQLFAATHNIECIEFFRQVLLEEEFAEYQKEARIITLRQRLKDPETVYSETHTFEDMEYAHQTELDLRGGQWV